ncbi:MAG TPA: histidine phosphatase family protein [Acidimicrobiales bacterium]|nr:histidine phosphatase family protein [Acidimicrobiales bacterium]
MTTVSRNQTIWLVRHGESTWNVLGLVQGHADQAVLTRQGRRQAQLLAHRLGGRTLEAVYSSDLHRAQQTATILADSLGLQAQPHAALRERGLGVLEGTPVTSVDPAATGIDGDRVVDTVVRPEGGESLDDLYRRVAGFVDWLRDQSHGAETLVVAHGGTVRMIRAYCAGRSVRDMTWDTVPNGSLWRVRMPDHDTVHSSHEPSPVMTSPLRQAR